MYNDLLLVFGILVGFLSFPAFLAAFSESRTPRVAVILIIVGGAMISFAVYSQPSGYSFDQLPLVFTRVFAQIFG